MAHEEYVRHTCEDKVVLFIHGFLGSPEHFEKFIELVPEYFGIYNVLLCGHGGNVRDFSKASMALWKEQVENIVLELNKRYTEIIIVAHSMGTLFAYDLANKYPETVKAMILLGTPLKIGVKGTAFANSFKSLFGLISDEDEIGKAYDKAHGVKLNLKLWEYIGWIPRYLELFSESKRGRTTIKNISVPCYIFQSARDELVSRKSERYIPQKENITLSILENSAHFIYDKFDFQKVAKLFSKILGDKI